MRPYFRFFTAFLLCLGLIFSLCHADGSPIYEAWTDVQCNLRREPDSASRCGHVPEFGKVLILEYGDEWCKVQYEKSTGWLKTEWLWHYRSLDPMNHPVPGVTPMTGFITLSSPASITGDGFKGAAAEQGAVICYSGQAEDACILPVWRSWTALPVSSGQLHPFTPWRDAAPGDMISGFTTFFNEEGRGTKGDNRVFNIQEGCLRIDQTTIPAGETFSFNALCGPYTKKNGYLEARNIGNDGVGYGGGICQVTTTLYNAVIALPLQVEEWEIHRWRGVEYIPQFFDAAVGAYSDFSFTNTLPYPITLHCHLSNGVITVLISRSAE